VNSAHVDLTPCVLICVVYKLCKNIFHVDPSYVFCIVLQVMQEYFFKDENRFVDMHILIFEQKRKEKRNALNIHLRGSLIRYAFKPLRIAVG
jgi:hypothetical protein